MKSIFKPMSEKEIELGLIKVANLVISQITENKFLHAVKEIKFCVPGIGLREAKKLIEDLVEIEYIDNKRNMLFILTPSETKYYLMLELLKMFKDDEFLLHRKDFQ